MHHSVQMFGAPEVLQALAALGESLHTGKNPFEHVHGMVVWDWLSSHPDEGARLAGAMVEATGRDSPLIAASYPFDRFERICDVAGGKGALLGGILARHRGPRGVLFDEPYVVHRAEATLAAAGVAERVECVGGSFFEAVPPGCDAYLLKDILHDWDDRRAATILDNVRRSATEGVRLLLIETLLEPNETRSPIAAVDVFMLTICAGGRQRSLAELERLLTGAGFALEEAIALPSLHSIVVARAVV
jgi:hypothetical protein